MAHMDIVSLLCLEEVSMSMYEKRRSASGKYQYGAFIERLNSSISDTRTFVARVTRVVDLETGEEHTRHPLLGEHHADSADIAVGEAFSEADRLVDAHPSHG